MEQGIAPDSILATNNARGISRPLCPYPEVARYSGKAIPMTVPISSVLAAMAIATAKAKVTRSSVRSPVLDGRFGYGVHVDLRTSARPVPLWTGRADFPES
jgi:hypothetical protein